MKLTSEYLKDQLKKYDLGELLFNDPLETGFESTNCKIVTTKGTYAARIIHHNPQKVVQAMKIYDFIWKNGILTPLPIKTISGDFSIIIDSNESFVIQTFIEGAGYYREHLSQNTELFKKMLPIYGKEMGKFHKAGMNWIGGSEGDSISDVYLINPDYLHLPENEYVHQKYIEWKAKADVILQESLTKGIVHGDIKPNDFFLENEVLTGIMDLNSAKLDFIISDIACFMMYTGLWRENNQKNFLLFIKSYIEANKIKITEFKFLQFFLLTRGFVQTFYFSHRLKNNLMHGIDDSSENNKGFEHGISMIKDWSKIDENYFYDIIINNRYS